ncbi:MAG: hypothetical protein QXG57_06155 [Thermofilaceae archaeon]
MARRKKVKVTTAVQMSTSSETIEAPTRMAVWSPFKPPESEEIKQLVQQVDELLERHHKTAMPTELRAELRVLTQMAAEAINLANTIAERINFEPALFSSHSLVSAYNRLDTHIRDLLQRIRKRATFLKMPMPELPARVYPYFTVKIERPEQLLSRIPVRATRVLR